MFLVIPASLPTAKTLLNSFQIANQHKINELTLLVKVVDVFVRQNEVALLRPLVLVVLVHFAADFQSFELGYTNPTMMLDLLTYAARTA